MKKRKRSIISACLLCATLLFFGSVHAGQAEEKEAMEIPQTGFTTAVPSEYLSAAQRQGSLWTVTYDSEDYVRDGAPIT